MKVVKLTIDDSRYPYLLKQIYEPPKELYCIGDLRLLEKEKVAMVGSRKCSEYGKDCAYQLGKKLSYNDITVVSGLALGIDTFSHKGGLSGSGSTIAIVASGIELCYPGRNLSLWQEISRRGLIISEHSGEYRPKPYDFPRRNRIISGLCESVVVLEAGEKSGSLITAECALEQNRNVYALPGNITSHYSQGTNRLIKEGAFPLINFNDIIHELGLVPREEVGLSIKLGKDEKAIFDRVNQWGEVSKIYLEETTGFSPSKVNGLLSVLEIKGLVKSSMGKIYIAK